MAVSKEDRRRKLTDEQRDEVIEKYKKYTLGQEGGLSKRQLAYEYHVRRYTISTIINPELQKRDYEKRKLREARKDGK